MIVISMGIARYIIWTTSYEDTNEIMETLKPHSSVVVSVTDVILCVETTLTAGRIRGYVGDNMEMACLEIDAKFIKKLMETKFIESERKNFRRFLTMTKVPESINEALDLINERGGVDLLSEREMAALNRLTDNSE